MNAKDDAGIREQLLRLKTELEALETASRDAAQTVELDQTRVGRLSRMDALQGQQMALEAGRRRKQQLQRIEGALRRLDAGDYGCCFKCGEDIGERRLAADPTHTRCIDCVES